MSSIGFTDNLQTVECDEWNALADGDVFTGHEFLSALEANHCVGAVHGWHPCHVTMRDDDNTLCAAMPMYLKTNGYGEFVFDWAWERAYAESGLAYYPKLVIASPYTPITGKRLLGGDHCKTTLVAAAMKAVGRNHCSGVHWLFFPEDDRILFERAGFILRLGCQYHWHNNSYISFDDFLGTLTSKKRKMIRRERRLVRDQGIRHRVLHGGEITQPLWDRIYQLYKGIYDQKWGYAVLSRGFFTEVGATLPENIVVMLALKRDELVACAINFTDGRALYGRHWGCQGYHECLHFETCYYAGIEYCIDRGLQTFEPGAQGEHKISRGFLPVPTWSAHQLNHPEFMRAAADYCRQERALMTQQITKLYEWSPYRKEAMPPAQQRLFDEYHAAG